MSSYYYYYSTWYIVRSCLFDIGILLTIIPIIKEGKQKIKWYQTPFVYLFLCFIENLSTFLIFRRYYGGNLVQLILSSIIEFVLIILIIFLDKEFKIAFKLITFFSFIALSLIFFFVPAELRFYSLGGIIGSIAGLGPIECLITSILAKNYEIVPIFTIICILLVNIIDIFATEVVFFFVASIVGIASCISQLIIYCVLRAKRNQENIITQPITINSYLPPQQLSQSNENLTPQPIAQPITSPGTNQPLQPLTNQPPQQIVQQNGNPPMILYQQPNIFLPQNANSGVVYVPVYIQPQQNPQNGQQNIVQIPINPQNLQFYQPNLNQNQNINQIQNINRQVNQDAPDTVYEKPKEDGSINNSEP